MFEQCVQKKKVTKEIKHKKIETIKLPSWPCEKNQIQKSPIKDAFVSV